MIIKSIANILDEITHANIEEKYQEIYVLCQSDSFTSDGAGDDVELLKAHYFSSDNDVFRSYYFLFLGAVLDSKKYDRSIDGIVQFLVGEVTTLTDFRVKDGLGNYVHYLSHAIYLASSLRENDLCTVTQLFEVADILVAAYLRCNLAFTHSEDLILAEFLLRIKPSPSNAKSIIQHINPVSAEKVDSRSQDVIRDTNKRILWMSMFMLNSKYKTYPNSIFKTSINLLVEKHFE